MIVLIPAYEPDERLPALVQDLTATARPLTVVVVDDGSGPRFGPVFAIVRRLGATVLTHPANRGKGAVLRTGLAHIRTTHPGQDVVCADSDGQHLVADILAVADRLVLTGAESERQRPIVLGTRQFVGRVPARSRIGNEATRWFVRLSAGLRLRDTQTGLRGYPAELLTWLLDVPGDRFEYEMAVLLRSHAEGRPIVEVPIETVYHEGNAGSHFRPVADSARVYAPVLRFAGSSLLAAVLDVVGLMILMALTGDLLASVVGARVLSATVNFTVNRRLVFASSAPVVRSAARYLGLAAALLAANYALMWLLTSAGLALLVAKAITETALYLTSFAVQSRVVFRSRSRTSPGHPTDQPEDYPMSRRNVVKRPMSTSTTA